MLLKGLGEVQIAPSPIQAAQMVLVRLAYVADLPAPAELVRALTSGAGSGAVGNGAGSAAMPPTVLAALPRQSHSLAPSALPPAPVGNALRAPAEDAEPGAEPVASAPPAVPSLDYEPMPQSFAEVLALFDRRREAVLRSQLASYCHLVHFEPGRIEFRPADGAPRALANQLGQLLGEWTGARWLIAVSEAAGEPTLLQQGESRDRELRNEVTGHPLVQAVLETFPGATIAAIRERFAPAAEAEAAESEKGEGDEPDTEEDLP